MDIAQTGSGKWHFVGTTGNELGELLKRGSFETDWGNRIDM